jgi:hypothetical protein
MQKNLKNIHATFFGAKTAHYGTLKFSAKNSGAGQPIPSKRYNASILYTQ